MSTLLSKPSTAIPTTVHIIAVCLPVYLFIEHFTAINGKQQENNNVAHVRISPKRTALDL